jgi:hypothetical protein
VKLTDQIKMIDEILGSEDGRLTMNEIGFVEQMEQRLNGQQTPLSPKQEQELERIWSKIF